MSMEKRGIVANNDVEVVGVSTDDGAYICDNCNKIIMCSQEEEVETCPFCKTAKKKNKGDF